MATEMTTNCNTMCLSSLIAKATVLPVSFQQYVVVRACVRDCLRRPMTTTITTCGREFGG